MSRRRNKNKGCLFGIISLMIECIAMLINLTIKCIIGIIKAIKKLLQPKAKEEEYIPQYRRRYLLTKHELEFYKELKKAADKLNLSILTKIRMADLVEAINNDYRGFAKIKAKHVDFALCNPENMYVLLLIELDDNSHQRQDRIERDMFIEQVYTETGYKLLRVKSTYNLEKAITEALQPEK